MTDYDKGFMKGYIVGYQKGINHEQYQFFIIYDDRVMCDYDKVMLFNDYYSAELEARLIKTLHLFDCDYRLACTISDDYTKYEYYNVFKDRR